MSRRLSRIFSIGLIIVAVGWFGHRFGNRPQVVEAKVFERLLQFTRSMPPYGFEDDSAAGPRKTKFNGNTLHLTVTSSEDSLRQILDFYERQYPQQPAVDIDKKDLAEVMEKVDNGELRDSLKTVLEYARGFTSHFRMERKTWALWGAFEPHDPTLALSSVEYLDGLKLAFGSGRLGELGIGRVVIALKEPAKTKTTILNIWTDRLFQTPC